MKFYLLFHKNSISTINTAYYNLIYTCILETAMIIDIFKNCKIKLNEI